MGKRSRARGLPNIQSMVDAIPALMTEKSVRMFEKFGVFTKAELNSRAEIQYEGYAKALNIEARAMIDIASKHIIPAVMRYAKNLAETANEIREAGADDSVPVEILKRADSSSLRGEKSSSGPQGCDQNRQLLGSG